MSPAAAAGRAPRRPGRSTRRARARRHQVRRVAAAALAGLAVAVAVSALRPAQEAPGVPTLVAARDVPAGSVLGPADLDVVAHPGGSRPSAALASPDDVTGRTAAGPIAAGEVLTTARLAGPSLLDGQPDGYAAVSLPVAGGTALGLAPGARVDVYATGTGERVTAGALVLAAPGAPADPGLGLGADPAGGQVLLALPSEAVRRVAAASGALQTGETFLLALRRD